MTTYITVVLDRSGSMYSQLDDTIGGYNLFIEEQTGETYVTLITFSNTVTVDYKNINIKAVPKLTKETYKPRGGTALFDAIGMSIKNNDQLCDDNKDDSVNYKIVILTDGEENSSKIYRTSNHINDLITDRKKQGWEFIFLAANQDAIRVGNGLGIPAEAALNFSQSDSSTGEAFKSAACAIKRSLTGETQGIQFSQVERNASMGIDDYIIPHMEGPPKIVRQTNNQRDLTPL
tara:strand:- start:8199 stop:8897 length:699 start_codon:yes stop_codon:yes gene_type:complete